jgi:hypothetical protein
MFTDRECMQKIATPSSPEPRTQRFSSNGVREARAAGRTVRVVPDKLETGTMEA